jgi:hypothetical protein
VNFRLLGDFFSLGQFFLKNTKVAQFVGLPFSTVKAMYISNIDEKWVGPKFG